MYRSVTILDKRGVAESFRREEFVLHVRFVNAVGVRPGSDTDSRRYRVLDIAGQPGPQSSA